MLLERNDFGGATSWNSLRIAHGGLRYLQTLDFRRFRRSVAEQAWWLKNFPDLVRPLKCLMPLYGVGLRRNWVMRGALRLNDHLASGIRRPVIGSAALPSSTVVSSQVTSELFPKVDREGLRGGAVWYDALIHSPQRLLMEVLRWAHACGGSSLNYVEASELIVEGGSVAGLTARCRETDEVVTIPTSTVVNCAGPWAQRLAVAFDRKTPEFFSSSLAFNVLLDRHPLAATALAITPKSPNGHTYFLVPHDDHMLAGTIHAPWSGDGAPTPSRELLSKLLRDLNNAVPSFRLEFNDILRVDAGILPARRPGSARPSRMPTLYEHGRHGGPRGLISVLGVKYTTARAVGEMALRALCDCERRPLPDYVSTDRPQPTTDWDLRDFPEPRLTACDEFVRGLRGLIERENVVHLDDLLLRRTDWCRDPREFTRIASIVAEALGWSKERLQFELRRMEDSPHPRTQLASEPGGS